MTCEHAIDAIYLGADLQENIHVAIATARPFLWMVCTIGRFQDVSRTCSYLAAVRQNGLSLRFSPSNLLCDLVGTAVKQNPLAVAHVDAPDPKMCFDCYRRNRATFVLFDDKGRRHVARLVLADSIMALRSIGLSPNLASEICVDLLCARQDLFPRIYVDEPTQDEIDAELLEIQLWHEAHGRLTYAHRARDCRTRDVSSWNMPIHDIWALVQRVYGAQ